MRTQSLRAARLRSADFPSLDRDIAVDFTIVDGDTLPASPLQCSRREGRSARSLTGPPHALEQGEQWSFTDAVMINRLRWGAGFTYRDQHGHTIRDRKLRRWLRSLAIPPAWTDVEIDCDPDAKIHATGRDSAGRKQYIYNTAWRESRDHLKYDRITRFARRLTAMRRITGQHLARHDNSREKVLACMVRLIDTAYFRPGNAQYAAENDSYGLTTLRSRHLSIEGDELIFRYAGKSGQTQEKHVEDERLARIVAELDHLPGRTIFKYFDAGGSKVDVSSEDLNEYIHEVMGEDFSAKDFRTWAGTSLAALALDALGTADNARQARANVRAAVRSVARRLGNTPAITKSSYIDPRVVECYLRGRTLRDFRNTAKDKAGSNDVGPNERAVLKLLESAIGYQPDQSPMQPE